MLGNYPEVSRLSLGSSNDMYAYTAWRDTSMTLTLINFTNQAQTASVSLSDAAFQGKQQKFWSEITDLDYRTFTDEVSTDVVLEAYESKVFLINVPLDQVFPPLAGIQLQSKNGESSIIEDGGSLQLEVVMDPANSMEEIEWVLEGDTHLATIENGLLQSCGCGDGLVTVIARSKSNPSVADQMDIVISTQSYGQILNPTFDEDLTEWHVYSGSTCNVNIVWDQGEAHITLEAPPGVDQGISVSNVAYMALKEGAKYRLSFDARSPTNKKMYAKINRSTSEWEQLFWDQYQLNSSMQHYSTKFTLNYADSDQGQLIFDFEGTTDEFWIDNISFCELVEEEPEPVKVTFRVDMQKEEVSGAGVYLNGSFCGWSTESAIQMDAEGSVYSTTLSLPVGERIEYKFVNGAADDWDQYELVNGLPCAYGNDDNRSVVPDQDRVLDLVCFGACSACETEVTGIGESLAGLRLFPNPVTDILRMEGLPAELLEFRIYDAQGRQIYFEQIQAQPAHELDMSRYPPGIYALSILDTEQQETFTLRLIKE